MGSEGNFGIITEAVIRLRPLPEVKKFDSYLFPNMELGVKFMEEIAHSRLWPASCRLVDNIQFKLGHSLKPESSGVLEDLMDAIKKFYVMKIKGFDQDKMVALTLLYEGTTDMVSM